MGLSVSAATMIIVIGMLFGFGIAYSAATTSVDDVSSAHMDRVDSALALQNSAFEITAVSYNESANRLEIQAENTGTEPLDVGAVDYLIDGDIAIPDQIAVEGSQDTTLWLPGERVVGTFEGIPEEPERTMVVAERGLSRSQSVQSGEN